MVGVDKIPRSAECIVIVDESDDISMKGPVKFVKKTMSKNLQVVFLTATPDDGVDDGSERELMNLMGYKLIRTGAK